MRGQAMGGRWVAGLWLLLWCCHGGCLGASKSMANISERGSLVLDHDALEGDKRAVEAALAVPLHSSTSGFSAAPQEVERWRNLGFAPSSPDSRYSLVRGAALVERQPIPLVPTQLPGMPAIDAIAVISIYREDVPQQYIYPMLRSTFDAFEADIEINVLVGNADGAYLATEVLKTELGASRAARVHVWTTAAETADFLGHHFERRRRGSWNYARALLAYGGSRGLLLLEDDVEWGPRGGEVAAALLAEAPLQVVSLYNYQCFRPDGQAAGDRTAPAITTRASRQLLQCGFTCTQAMYFPAEVVAPVGRHIQLRMHEMPYDMLMHNFFLHHELAVNYTYPSLVQHVGRQTAIHTSPGFHQTRCFHGDGSW